METGITAEQLQKLMESQANMTKEIVAEAIKAAKEPTQDEADKKAELKRRADLSKKQAVEQTMAEQRSKDALQSNCNHRKENGKFATGGQIIGGKYAMLVCQHCRKEWFKEFDAAVTSQLLSGDLVLSQADPHGWDVEKPWSKVAVA